MSSIYLLGSKHVFVEAQSQPAKGTSRTPSYADTTRIRVDGTAKATLRSYGNTKIAAWTGKNLAKIIDGTQTHITVRDARLINQYADTPVFNLTAENVVEFTVDSIIRDRLKSIKLAEAQPALDELGATEREFYGLKYTISSITTKDAETYHRHLNSIIFDKERVFILACNEPIVEKKEKGAMIEITPDHRTKLRGLSAECKQKLIDNIGANFKNFLIKTKKLSVENAEVIHQISGQIIFDLPDAKGKTPALPSQARGTKRPLAVPPGDPSALPSKKQRIVVDDVNVQMPQAPVYTYSIPQVPVFTGAYSLAFDEIPQAPVSNAPATLSQEPQFTPLIETNGNENSLSTANSSVESDELYYFDQFVSVNSSSTATVAPAIQEILPFPSIYEDWDSLNM